MKTRKLRISVGIPAYNEQQNIKNVLRSVCDQKGKSTEIKEIIVVSDGSTDKTADYARLVKDSRIRVIKLSKRHGKPVVLNRLFNIFKGEVLVIVDADSILGSENVIEKLTLKFQKDGLIGLVTGHAIPLPANTFLEGSINNYIYARNELFDKYNIGKSAYATRGFLAYSRKFLKDFRIPNDILSDDSYSYFYCLNSDFKVFHEKEAIVRYKSPQIIKDHIKQSTRHFAGGIQLTEYFGRKPVEEGFSLPRAALIRIMIHQFIRNPFGYIFLKLLNTFCYYKSIRVVKDLDIKWDLITTSKKLVTN